MSDRSIAFLPELVDTLSDAERNLFRRLYHISRTTGRLVVPPSAHGWAEETFGSIRAAERQTIVRVTNLVTLDGAIFNPLRASRPIGNVAGDLQQIIEDSRGDQFCHPEELTPEDSFGRVRGRHCLTASNIAKYAPFHGVVISNQHDPLQLSEEWVRDYLEVGRRWADEALKIDPEARYYFFAWNAVWAAGASVIHGHAQVSCTRGTHYPKIEALRRAAATYARDQGSSYFEDLYQAHAPLGLAFRDQDVAVLAHLTPVRDKEVVLVARDERALARPIYRALDCLMSVLGTRSFNVAIYQPPLAPSPEEWTGFPFMARIVDRGNPMRRTADVGCMELYACPVIPTDPFRVIDVLRKRFGEAAEAP